MKSTKIEKRIKRKKRVRSKVFGTAERPRLSVFRSNKHIFVQLIDDGVGKTLVSMSDIEITGKSKKEEKAPKKDLSQKVGMALAKKALDKKIKRAVYDKGGYMYHGRVEEIAKGAREGGLEF